MTDQDFGTLHSLLGLATQVFVNQSNANSDCRTDEWEYWILNQYQKSLKKASKKVLENHRNELKAILEASNPMSYVDSALEKLQMPLIEPEPASSIPNGWEFV